MELGITHQVKQLYEVEKLSQRQIATQLGISRKTILRILREDGVSKPLRETIFKPYERLVQEWYKQYPFLRVTQVYERLKGYGYSGGYDTVKLHTQSLRKKKTGWFHELEFLPGEEAQGVCDKFMRAIFTPPPDAPKNLPNGCSECCSAGR